MHQSIKKIDGNFDYQSCLCSGKTFNGVDYDPAEGGIIGGGAKRSKRSRRFPNTSDL